MDSGHTALGSIKPQTPWRKRADPHSSNSAAPSAESMHHSDNNNDEHATESSTVSTDRQMTPTQVRISRQNFKHLELGDFKDRSFSKPLSVSKASASDRRESMGSRNNETLKAQYSSILPVEYAQKKNDISVTYVSDSPSSKVQNLTVSSSPKSSAQSPQTSTKSSNHRKESNVKFSSPSNYGAILAATSGDNITQFPRFNPQSRPTSSRPTTSQETSSTRASNPQLLRLPLTPQSISI
jgi:hypothetical protein